MKEALRVFVILVAMAGVAIAADPIRVAEPVADDGSQHSGQQVGPILGPGLITDSPGTVIGISSYEYQTNGSSGNRIAVDTFGGIHVSWTKGMALAGRPRHVYYNFRDENGTWMWPGEGTQVSSMNGSGFTTIELLDGGEAVVAYHAADATPMHSISAIDAFRGFGIFTEYFLDSGQEYIWPYISKAGDGRFHLIATAFEAPQPTAYTFSTDGAQNWSQWQHIRDMDILSNIICSSPVSSKTAVVYTADVGGIWDVFYFEAVDGESWDWRFPVNLTEFTPIDSMSAWADVDAIYDYDDNLHISYQGALALDDGLYLNSTKLMHWSEATGHTVIAIGPEDGCAQINYCLCVAKMSLAVNPSNNNIFAIWSELNMDDVSLAGFSNGDLFGAGSADGGETWFDKVNLTDSPTPGCAPPDCDSDVWSSLAEKVDGALHIMYVDDDDAGAAWRPEGIWTFNRVLYLEIDEGELIPLSVYDPNPDLPFEFKLGENYPNPFNAETTIPLDGEIREGRLAIYDITGRMIREFGITPETRSITWDGANSSGETVASGTYFYSVAFDGFGTAAVRKMTLLK